MTEEKKTATAPQPLLSRAEASQYLNCSERMLDQLRAEKKPPKFIRLGRLVRYRLNDLEKYVEKNAEEPKKRAYSFK
mgnify:CR=1 FL=1